MKVSKKVRHAAAQQFRAYKSNATAAVSIDNQSKDVGVARICRLIGETLFLRVSVDLALAIGKAKNGVEHFAEHQHLIWRQRVSTVSADRDCGRLVKCSTALLALGPKLRHVKHDSKQSCKKMS